VRDRYAYAIVLIAWIIGGMRVLRRHVKPEGGAIGDELAHQVYLEVTDRENGDRRNAELRFQGSPWSQQDDFHAKEKGTLRYVGSTHHLTVSSVINAVDRGMREGWPTHANVVVTQKVIPCRPRLAY
jgi:hypothetical protein